MNLIGIIQDLDPSAPSPNSLVFDFFETFPRTSEANWEEIPIRGRGEPHQFYGSSPADVWDFRLWFTSSIEPGDRYSPEQLVRDLDWLQSLTKPDVNDAGLVLPPPIVAITVADGSYVNHRGRVTSLRIEPRHPLDASGRPTVAEVSFQLTAVSLTPPTRTSVRQRNLITL